MSTTMASAEVERGLKDGSRMDNAKRTTPANKDPPPSNAGIGAIGKSPFSALMTMTTMTTKEKGRNKWPLEDQKMDNAPSTEAFVKGKSNGAEKKEEEKEREEKSSLLSKEDRRQKTTETVMAVATGTTTAKTKARSDEIRRLQTMTFLWT
jgi:hypothetical protein